jgi:hypothetical protein
MIFNILLHRLVVIAVSLYSKVLGSFANVVNLIKIIKKYQLCQYNYNQSPDDGSRTNSRSVVYRMHVRQEGISDVRAINTRIITGVY